MSAKPRAETARAMIAPRGENSVQPLRSGSVVPIEVVSFGVLASVSVTFGVTSEEVNSFSSGTFVVTSATGVLSAGTVVSAGR